VLLVEDNDINRLYARSILKKWHCYIDVAENGLVAIEKVKNSYFDVVLMDVQMPVMDGYEATRAIRMLEPSAKIPIIALTANATPRDIEKCLEAGMNDYLPKPFTPDDLYRKLFDDLKIKPSDDSLRKIRKAIEPSYNLDYLRSVSGNNQEFIREMVSTFIQTIPNVLGEMHSSIEKQDWNKLSRLAHQIKPSFILMGLDALRSNLVFIEENSKAEVNLEEVDRLTHEFINRCNQVIPELSKELTVTDQPT
jgi:hypothetical protein